jgi:Putative Ig domain/Ricin-type beta-trefoil lectin domain
MASSAHTPRQHAFPAPTAWLNPVTGNSDIGLISLATGSFAVQPLWDNNIYASAGDGCLDHLSLTSPGNRASTIGTAVSLQVAATSSSGVGLSYRASGLPPGLSISSSGKISGTPAVTAGTYATRVTASDSTGVAKSVSFTWAVRSATGAIKGNGSKCADDYRSVTANGNKIDINACNGGSAQKMTFLSNGEVTVLGKCIRDSSGRIVLYTCNGATTEVWTRHSNGEYVIKYNSQCLTKPSTTNGTQLQLANCTDSASQRWSLP